MADPQPGAPVAIPALTFRQPGWAPDLDAIIRYARHATGMPARYFLISGTTGRGGQATVRERAQVLRAWQEVASPGRLLAACWERDDFLAAADLGVRPMLVMRDCGSTGAVLDRLGDAPRGCWVYSHPRYSPVTFTPAVAEAAREAGLLPGGAKVSKVKLGDLAALRAEAGQEFALWHGSSRDIAASLAHGATGVVSAPLSALPSLADRPDEPGACIEEAQRAADEVQAMLDRLGDSTSRIDFLLASAARACSDGLS